MSATTTYRVLAGYHRHIDVLCRPGMYYVSVCLGVFPVGFDAVCDDFGNLVKVTQ